jgi:hypothetical protein
LAFSVNIRGVLALTSGISFCEKCQQLQTSKFFIFVPPILGFGPGIGEKAREFH